MSWQPADKPAAAAPGCPALDTIIIPRARDIGGFEVRRALPHGKRPVSYTHLTLPTIYSV